MLKAFLRNVLPTFFGLALVVLAFTVFTLLDANAAPTPGGPHRLRTEKADTLSVISVYWDDTSTAAYVFTFSDTHRGRPNGYLETTWRDNHMTTSQGNAKTAAEACTFMWFDPLEYEALPLTSGQLTVYRDDCAGSTGWQDDVWGILPIYWVRDRNWL